MMFVLFPDFLSPSHFLLGFFNLIIKPGSFLPLSDFLGFEYIQVIFCTHTEVDIHSKFLRVDTLQFSECHFLHL